MFHCQYLDGLAGYVAALNAAGLLPTMLYPLLRCWTVLRRKAGSIYGWWRSRAHQRMQTGLHNDCTPS